MAALFMYLVCLATTAQPINHPVMSSLALPRHSRCRLIETPDNDDPCAPSLGSVPAGG